MKKYFLTPSYWCFFLSVFILFDSYSQNDVPVIVMNKGAEPCVSDQLHEERMLTDSIYRQKTIDFNVALSSFNPTVEVSNTTYRVPVVIHVMETGNSLTQISDEQIREGIKQLNERYRKVPGSLGDGNGVDVEIEFALAVQDPNGNCTNGIVRYDMTGNASYMSHGVFRNSAGIADADLKALSFWNSNNYYNIWLISEIDNNNGGPGVQGYAYFAGAHGFSIDGAVILCSNWRNPQSTTGAHELGHAFNLYHTFEGDNGGNTCPPDSACSVQGDFVCDTPPHMRSVSNCNSTGTNSCDGGSSNGSTSDSIVATISGPYSVTYTGSNGCSSTSAIVDVVVNQLPAVTISSFTDVCDYAEAFSLIGGLPIRGSYNGIGVSGGVFDPSVAGIGIHSITYQYTDLNGCVNSTQANLSVNDCTDLLEIKTDEVLVYPNPASKTVFVKTKTYDIASINVFDATGRLIARYNGQSKNIEVDISNVAIGIYNLEIQIENKVFRTRLVKK